MHDTSRCTCTCHNGGRFASCDVPEGCAHLHVAVEQQYDGYSAPVRAERSIGPCQMPGCRDVDGNARLTRDTICEPSRRHYGQVIDRLVLHYILLRVTLPKPAPPPGERVMRVVAKTYGHPAEWASDSAAAIASLLNETHDALAEHLGHDPAPHPGSREYGRVAHAHHYLTSWFDRLCTFPGAGDTAEAIVDLDRDVRRGLGKTDPQRHLPVPCPECELLTLVRSLDSNGTDEVECRACGHVIRAEHYGLWTRMLVDDVLRQDATVPG